METPSSIKTDNGPTYISRQFKKFLHPFFIKHITDIPYNPQAQDIVEWTHHTLKLQIKKFKKGEYTGTLLSSLSRADFTRFQCNIFFKSLGLSRQEYWSGLPFPSPIYENKKWKGSRSIVSHSSWPHGLQPARLLCPWDFPGKSLEKSALDKEDRSVAVYSLFLNFFICSFSVWCARSTMPCACGYKEYL